MQNILNNYNLFLKNEAPFFLTRKPRKKKNEQIGTKAGNNNSRPAFLYISL